MNESWDAPTGRLRILNDEKNMDDYVEEINAGPGTLVAFKVTGNCWHGFKTFEGKRLSIQLNYIYPEALRTHNLRHKISSGLKSIFNKKK